MYRYVYTQVCVHVVVYVTRYVYFNLDLKYSSELNCTYKSSTVL